MLDLQEDSSAVLRVHRGHLVSGLLRVGRRRLPGHCGRRERHVAPTLPLPSAGQWAGQYIGAGVISLLPKHWSAFVYFPCMDRASSCCACA